MRVKKSYKHLLMLSFLFFFIGCGDEGFNSFISSRNNSEVVNYEGLYLHQKTEYTIDGKVKIKNYQYDSNNHLIYDGCTNSYDNLNRITEINCKEENSIYHYDGKKLSSYELYKNGQIFGKWSVLEWNNHQKPKVIQWKINVANNWITYMMTLGYTGNNTTSIKTKTIRSNGMSFTSEIEQTFDNKKTPYDGSKNMFGGYAVFVKQGFLTEISTNNVLKQKITSNGKTININHEITYNDKGYPIRIDSYRDGEHYYSIYEYVELD